MLYSSIGENPDLKVRLLQSKTNATIRYENSVAFAALLAKAGCDVQMIPYTGDHTTPLEPTVQIIRDILENSVNSRLRVCC